MREAFRLNRHAWPGAYDVVVVVQPSRRGEAFTSTRVARLLNDAVPRLHATAEERAAKSADRG